MHMLSGLGVGEQREGGDLLGEIGEGCRMSRRTRMIGFACCFGIGMLLSFLSPVMILNPTGFAITYTVGNLLAIGSTTFLVGPRKQVKYMFDKTRVVATLIYLVCLGATLWAGLTKQHIVLVIVLLLLQFCALVWYTASYIPYARQAIQSCLCSCVRGGGSA